MKFNNQVRENLFVEVEHLTNEELNKKPSENEWSIKQVLEHLYLMEGAIAKTIQYQLSSGEDSAVGDKPIELSVNRSTKVQAPDFATPSDDFATLDELKEKLSQTHEALSAIAYNTPSDMLRAKSYPHPVFGDMNLSQWIPFTAYHEMRHTEQIKEVKEKLGLK